MFCFAMITKNNQQRPSVNSRLINNNQSYNQCIGTVSLLETIDDREKTTVKTIKYQISNTDWDALIKKAETDDILPFAVILNTFIHVIERWSSSSRLILTPIVVSDVEAVSYLEQLFSLRKVPWNASCKYLESQIFTDIKAEESEDEDAGISVFITTNLEVTSATNKESVALFLNNNDEVAVKGLHYQLEETNDGIEISWTFNHTSISEVLLQEMFAAQIRILDWLVQENWDAPLLDILPENQKSIRAKINNTQTFVTEKCLHQEFFETATTHSEKTALIWEEEGSAIKIGYGDLKDKVLRLASILVSKNIQQGDFVGITIPRGPNQIVAVLAVLAIGAIYVPIGVDQPKSRQKRIHQIAGISYVIMDEEVSGFTGLDVAIIQVAEEATAAPLSQPIFVDPNKLAYVIFTSGSTGEPKGVAISHSAAHNTIQDINKRFSVTEKDTALALSALDFDLSVYDIFGLLAVGGTLVMLNEKVRREASVWTNLIQSTGVTIWNSVPALLEMLLSTTLEKERLVSLRLVMVSGDWVGLDLFERLRNVSPDSLLVALGGATEASIWSNFHKVTYVDPKWSSIPYGKPLENQCFRVVDLFGRDCPDRVTGELWIGGIGLAKGYLGQPDLTADKFITMDNQRWYRTGDLGRYWSDGTLEFLGRKDDQVKLRGYRIELGEIEALLKKSWGVEQAVAAIASIEGTQHLVAAVVSEKTATNSAIAEPIISEEVLLYRTVSREKQAVSIEVVLFELLHLEKLLQNKDVYWNPMEQFELAEEHLAVVQLWLEWLVKRQLLMLENKTYRIGNRLQEVFEAWKVKSTVLATDGIEAKEDVFLKRVQKCLFERIPDYYKILSGNIAATVLLDDPIISPEILATKDAGTLWGIQEIAIRINKLAVLKGRPIQVAVLGGRTGLMTARLLKISSAAEISCTLLETAPSMIEAAKKNLEPFPENASCYRIPENRIPEELHYKFDVVLAINALHRYKDPEEGVALASLLVANQGKIIALEHGELSPIAVVTSALLDKGYTDFDHQRKGMCSPMLTGQEWMRIFSKYGYTKISCHAVGCSFTELIEVECPEERKEISSETIMDYVSQHLPSHMVPEKIVVLPWFPLSKNGKVNRSEITKYFDFQAASTCMEEPHKGMEQEIADIWKELLHTAVISRYHSFFQIGGDSLLGTRFLTIIKERFEIDVSLRQLFEFPTLIAVAAIVEEKYNVLAERMEEMEEMEEGEI